MIEILAIASFLSFFLSVLVYLKKDKGIHDYLFASWLVFTGIHIITVFFEYLNYQNGFKFPWLIGLGMSWVMVHPIWLLVYILSFVSAEKRISRFLWHLIPIVFVNLFMVYTYYSRPAAEKIEVYKNAMAGTGYIDSSLELTVLIIISISLAYLIASILVLRKHKRNVRNHYSYLKGVDLRWLDIISYTMAVAILVAIFAEWIPNYSDIVSVKLAASITYTIILLAISYVGINGLRQPSLIIQPDSGNVWKPNHKRNKTSTHKEVENNSKEDYRNLVHFIETEKPYLENSLNVYSLAKMVNIKPRYLSQVINRFSGKNFFDFINYYRVEEFKSLVRKSEYENITLLSIAYDCGFNSKATFNRVFKNVTGYTPSEFHRNKNLR